MGMWTIVKVYSVERVIEHCDKDLKSTSGVLIFS